MFNQLFRVYFVSNSHSCSFFVFRVKKCYFCSSCLNVSSCLIVFSFLLLFNFARLQDLFYFNLLTYHYFCYLYLSFLIVRQYYSYFCFSCYFILVSCRCYWAQGPLPILGPSSRPIIQAHQNGPNNSQDQAGQASPAPTKGLAARRPKPGLPPFTPAWPNSLPTRTVCFSAHDCMVSMQQTPTCAKASWPVAFAPDCGHFPYMALAHHFPRVACDILEPRRRHHHPHGQLAYVFSPSCSQHCTSHTTVSDQHCTSFPMHQAVTPLAVFLTATQAPPYNRPHQSHLTPTGYNRNLRLPLAPPAFTHVWVVCLEPIKAVPHCRYYQTTLPYVERPFNLALRAAIQQLAIGVASHAKPAPM